MSTRTLTRSDPFSRQTEGCQKDRTSDADASAMSTPILRPPKIPTDNHETGGPDSRTVGSTKNLGSPRSTDGSSVSTAIYTGLKIPTDANQNKPLVKEIRGHSAEKPAHTCRGVKKLLRNREDPRKHRLLWLSARMWGCPGCRQTLKENWFRDLLPRVAASKHLEELHFPKGKGSKEYKAIQRKIERRGACCVSIAQPEGAVAVLTTAHVGGEPVPINRLSELIKAIPEDLPHRCHPVSPSANWRTPKQKARREWEVVGSAKTDESETGTFHEAKKVLDRNGIAFDLSAMRVEGVDRPCLLFYLTKEMLNDTQRYHKFIISLGLEPRVLKEPRAA